MRQTNLQHNWIKSHLNLTTINFVSIVQPVKASRSFHRCNYCFKTFTKAESYKVHIEEHTREQGGAVVLFDCKICSMKFFTEVEFQDHMNIHNGNRPYKCFVCDKEFCIAEHLQDHVRLHSDATSRVRCEEGSNRFQMPDDLIRHSAIHAWCQEGLNLCNRCTLYHVRFVQS